MKNWLIENAIWLGALGAIAAIIATLMIFLPTKWGKSSAQETEGGKVPTQEAVVNGTHNATTQTQKKSIGNQTATIRGEENITNQNQ